MHLSVGPTVDSSSSGPIFCNTGLSTLAQAAALRGIITRNTHTHSESSAFNRAHSNEQGVNRARKRLRQHAPSPLQSGRGRYF